MEQWRINNPDYARLKWRRQTLLKLATESN
jgi:hypothetical protein